MKIVESIFLLLAGIGVFLVGCKLLSDNMEKIANTRLKKLFFKTQNNKVVGVTIGTVATSIVQSSALTTVMVVGLVNSGIMTLYQATTVIIGANIGTTITGQIAALQSFGVEAFAIGLTGIGALMNIFSRKDKTKIIGNIIAGLGMVFVGLMLMKQSMSDINSDGKVTELFSTLTNPFLLFFTGIALTALIQSSSVVTSIIITMAASGIAIGTNCNDVLFIILGTNIGTCVTAILCSLDANVNAKRASMIHLLFNVFGSVIFFIMLLIWKNFMNDTLVKIFDKPATQIAMFHTLFNVVCAILFLPFTKYLVKIASYIIKDKKAPNKTSYLDKRLLQTPMIALEATIKQTALMLDMAMVSLDDSLKGFINLDVTFIPQVKKNNSEVDAEGKDITNYCVLISSNNSDLLTEKIISSIHDSLSDIDRISELADNITKYTDKAVKEDLMFSNTVKSQLGEMQDLIHQMYEALKDMILNKNKKRIVDIDIIEDKIDEMRKTLVNGHIDRLNKGECRPESSTVFINLSNNLERVGDHLSYIAHSYENQRI